MMDDETMIDAKPVPILDDTLIGLRIDSKHVPIVVSREAASKSVLMDRMLTMDSAATELDLPSIPDQDALGLLVVCLASLTSDPDDWRPIPAPLRPETDVMDYVPPSIRTRWSEIRHDQVRLGAMLHTANFVDCQPVFQFVAALIASELRNRTPDEIQKWFGL
jgi:hypothetical protein